MSVKRKITAQTNDFHTGLFIYVPNKRRVGCSAKTEWNSIKKKGNIWEKRKEKNKYVVVLSGMPR